MEELEKYWTTRYHEGRIGWDIGYPSTPIKEYVEGIENKDLNILIPGAGNAYEAEYLWKLGFKHVHIVDISQKPLEDFASRNPSFPKENLIHTDFFQLEGQYDLIIEQTFFCSFPPTLENRMKYAHKVKELLKSGSKLVGVLFNFPLTGDMEKRPFGGNKELYHSYFDELFTKVSIEACYNSIPERKGSEYFIQLTK